MQWTMVMRKKEEMSSDMRDVSMAERLVPWVERIVPLEIGDIVLHIELGRASKQEKR